jgi:chitinase
LAKVLVEGSGYSRYWEDEAMVPWIYNPLTGIMISYDDPQSLSLKADYVKAMNLGGIMIWQLGADDEQGSLLDALYSHLKD